MYRRYSLSKYFSTLLKTRTKGVYIGLIYFFKHESIISAVQTFFWAPTEHSFLFFGHLLVSPSIIYWCALLKKVGGCVLGLNVQDFFSFYFNCVVVAATDAKRRLRLIIIDASANNDIDLVVVDVVDGTTMLLFVHSSLLTSSSIHSSIAFGDGI